MTWTPTVQNCDNYMAEREGKYEYRDDNYVGEHCSLTNGEIE